MEALPLFHGMEHVSSCMQERHVHAQLHWTKRSWIGVAGQAVARSWSPFKTSVGLKNFGTGYFSFFIYNEGTALVRVTMLPSDGFLVSPQGISLDRMVHPVSREAAANKAKREGSVAVNHEIHLFSSQCFSHMHTLVGNRSPYTLDDDNLFE